MFHLDDAIKHGKVSVLTTQKSKALVIKPGCGLFEQVQLFSFLYRERCVPGVEVADCFDPILRKRVAVGQDLQRHLESCYASLTEAEKEPLVCGHSVERGSGFSVQR